MFRTIAYGAIALAAPGVASDVQSLFAQHATADQRIVQPASPLPLVPMKRQQLIRDLTDDDFATREAAQAELARHAHEHETMNALFAAIDAEERKQKENAVDFELLARARGVTGPMVKQETAKHRVRKDAAPHPWISYLPDDAALPPGLKAMIGKRDAFDTRLFFRTLPGVAGAEGPPGVLHFAFTLATEKFTELYEYWAYRDALLAENYADTMRMWALELERIRSGWTAEEKNEKNTRR